MCLDVQLAGDAHVHSPLGGQGMNLGITDAVALSHVLSGALEGGSPTPLEAHDATRRPTTRQVISLTDLLTTLTVMHGRPRQIRNLALGVCNPLFRRRLASRLSRLAHR
jgi:2-polyprenyl-6-methoxyphenol hydroxylase-like FAD-dependent oxidoreductase